LLRTQRVVAGENPDGGGAAAAAAAGDDSNALPAANPALVREFLEDGILSDRIGEQLAAGGGVAAPDLEGEAHTDAREVSAGVIWDLRGDAGVRALVAAAFGRAEARAASGTAWMLPYTAELLRDPYDAVRFVAQIALRAEPDVGPAGGGFDFLAPEAERRAFLDRLEDSWRQRRSTRRDTDLSAVLIDADGNLRVEAFRALLARRDLRRIYLGE
jgi:hypothetical protein